MVEAAPGKLPGHIRLTDFDVSLERGDAGIRCSRLYRGYGRKSLRKAWRCWHRGLSTRPIAGHRWVLS